MTINLMNKKARVGRPPNASVVRPPWALRIRQAREQAGLTQGQLAQAIPKSQTSYHEWEVGKYQPHLSDFEIIAKVTGVDYVWLLTGREPPDCKALRRLLAEAQEKDRNFAPTFIEAAWLLREEGVKADLLYIFDFVVNQILPAAQGSSDDGAAKEAIARKLDEERAEFRKGLDALRKQRLQPGKPENTG
jgi:transcriptional regulator with XRE-family HTH domain